ncbi:FecR family protein [Chitinophaga rhizophila]|uniref:FecR domain-containing protein n=1 Tax=Chitinophaga rhizophila TaxID=2866212 RepID=A0ABS7GJY8_9BACT|nr:FecR family protein [Chitinophaga rhizophila]MBW8688030.1 FecR domain-containing protein [Chitinophaga rhizophila]
MSERFFEIVIKDLAGDSTPEEGQELKHIMSEDAVSARQYELFRMYWAQNHHDHIDNRRLFSNVQMRISELEKEAGSDNMQPLMTPVRGKGRLVWISGVAAAVALLISAGVYYYKSQHEPLIAKFTSKGEKSTFMLDDGTRVTLNADSKLEYAAGFPEKNREVYLTGEAFFDVHGDAQKPFIIHTNKMDIRVLGTAFNVKSYPNEASTEATLLKGAIEVSVTDNPDEKIILKPSQKVVVSDYDSTRKKSVSLKDVVPSLTTMTYFRQKDTMIMETSWLQNKLTFQNEDFETLAKRMERWYNVSIRFNGNHKKQLRFTGILEGETVAEAFNALNLTEDFAFKIEDSTIVIY